MSLFFDNKPHCGICHQEHETHEHDLSLPKMNNKTMKVPKENMDMDLPKAEGFEGKEDYLGVPHHWTRAYKHPSESLY